MNKKQLSEQYYQVLSEGLVLSEVFGLLGRFASPLLRGVGGFARRNAGTIAKTGLGLGAGAYGISSLMNAMNDGGLGGLGDLGDLGSFGGNGGFGGRMGSGSKIVDADVARALASGDKESYYDYIAALKNSGMKMNDRTSSISSTRAMAYNMAKDRAKTMKELSLSVKTKKGKAFQDAKAKFETLKKTLGAGAYVDDPGKDLSGTKPDGSSFTVKGRKMTNELQQLYDEMNKAREEALNQEITVGQMEGKSPTTPAATPPSNNSPSNGNSDKPEEKKPPQSESFLKKYYKLLKEQDTGGGIGEVPGASTGTTETEEERKARKEEEAAEEKAAKEAAEKTENERLGQSLGTARQSFGRMRSLEFGGYNPLRYDRDTGPGSATHRGRMAQRGINIFQEPRSLDDANLSAAAARDIEREGPLDRYRDRGEVYRGMDERGFDLGVGDARALSGDSTRMYSPEFAQSIKQDLGFDPTGMTREEITKKASEIAKKKRPVDYNLAKQKDMDENPIGWEDERGMSSPRTNIKDRINWYTNPLKK